jgi:uncharacterized membrane protein YtjA (UPF0391 family)
LSNSERSRTRRASQAMKLPMIVAGTPLALPQSARWSRAGKEAPMLHWALIFFVVALIAAALGQGGVAGLSAEIGYLLVGVAVIFLVVALVSGHSTPVP